jgi:Flp pilus assembly protein TadG
MSRLDPRRRSRGQALVEFALILLPLVVILFGVLDFGRAIYAYNTLSNAARAGVRVAIVNQNAAGTGCAGGTLGTPPSTTQVSAHDCAVQAAVAVGPVTVTVLYFDPKDDTSACSPVQVGCLAEVTAKTNFVPVTPIISGLVGSGIALSSTSKEPVEFVCPEAGTSCVPGQ